MPTLPGMVAEHAARMPGKIAVRCGGDSLSYGDLQARADRIANALVAGGLHTGDRAAILAGNSIDYVAAWLGILAANLCAVPLPTMVTPDAVAAILRDSGAKALFASHDQTHLLEAWQPDDAARIFRIALDFGQAGWTTLADFIAGHAPAPCGRTPGPDDDFNIIYSSGTTGVPKGIIHTHALRANSAIGLGTRGFDGAARTLVTTALYSNWSMGALIYTLWHGGTAIVMPKFSVRACLETCVAEHPTIVYLVPVQIARLLDDPCFEEFQLGAMTRKWCAGSPLSAERKSELLRRWPGGLIEIYGMTEGAPFTLLDAERHPDKLATVGRADPPDDIKIIDDGGHELGAGEIGEIAGRARSVMRGYHNRSEESRAIVWRDTAGNSYFRSGDLGKLDADGFLTVLDRKKDMIISGGFNIYASDIEDVLRRHPDVRDAAVVGIASARWGEAPAAAVVLRAGGLASAEGLRDWANAKLGKVQRLTRVIVCEDLPRGTLGKVLKRALRERLQAD